MKEVLDDNFCFVCGRENPIGLRLSFDLDLPARTVSTVFRPRHFHQGWKNRLHGGILSAVLDEAMVNAAYLLDMPAVTAEMSIRFRAPADTRQVLNIHGTITDIRTKFLKAAAECRTTDGTCVAEASALLIRADPGVT